MLTKEDHDYCNSVVEEYIKELNSEDILLKKDMQPGNIFHRPLIIRDKDINGFKFIDHGTDLTSDEIFDLPIAGAIKDAQINGNPMVSRTIMGYTFINRAIRGESLKDGLKYLVDNAVLDVKIRLKEIYPETYNDVPFIGTDFLTFLKNKEGNYLTEVEYSAGYELKMYSNCGINPPPYIDIDRFDASLAKKLWNITYKR